MQLMEGIRIANLKQIAAMANVSQASVSLVRKGRRGVSDAVRTQIQNLLREHGYHYVQYDPQTSLQPAHSGTIQLFVYKKHAMLVDGNDGFVTSIIDALNIEARHRGHRLSVSVLGPNDDISSVQAALSTDTDGVLLIATEMSSDELCLFDSIGVPLVIIDSDFISSQFSCVTMNNRELAFFAVQHLLCLGHKQIGYLKSSVPTGNFRSRSQGYEEALTLAGLCIDEQHTYRLRPTLSGAYQDMCEQLRTSLPTAFFADNDILALGAIKALTEAGYRVPQDVSVIGVDNIPFGSVSAPPLCTMSISCLDIGRWAVALLIQSIAAPDLPKTKIQISASLVRRSSTDAPACVK